MSKDFNKQILIGRLGANPEVTNLPNGIAVNVPMYTEHKWRDRSGNLQVQKERHFLVFYGKLAENVAKYAKSGSRLFIEGRTQTRDWLDDTTGLKQYRKEVIVSEFGLQDSGKGGISAAAPAEEEPANAE